MPAARPSTVRLRVARAGAALLLMLGVGAAQGAGPGPGSQADQAIARVPAVRVQRAGVTVPGTPGQYNASITVRYGPSRPRAILLLMPGYLGGAGSFDRLARQIVARDPGVAVWAVDRRSNTLEPQAQLVGADTATLTRIVQDGLPVAPAGSVAFMRDWGLDVTLRDWRVAVQEARRLTPDVFLGGHSLGASLSGLYAAYDFDGRAGADDLRGLVMLDGLPGTLADREITADQYDQGGLNALGVLPGLRQLDRQPYVNTLVFGPKLASQAAAQARLAAAAPDALAPAQGLSAVPATNLAACLLQLENRYALLPFLTVQTGRPTNAVEAPSFLAMVLGGRDSHWLVGPQDSSRPVGWQDDPAAPTDGLDFVNRYWTPLADYTEWYFPNRLTLDVAAARAGTLDTPFEQTLRVWHTPSQTLPVLGISAQQGVTHAADFLAYGKTTRGVVTVRTLPGASHLDIVAARSDQVARWIVGWMRPLRTPAPGPVAGSADDDLAAAHVSP